MTIKWREREKEREKINFMRKFEFQTIITHNNDSSKIRKRKLFKTREKERERESRNFIMNCAKVFLPLRSVLSSLCGKDEFFLWILISFSEKFPVNLRRRRERRKGEGKEVDAGCMGWLSVFITISAQFTFHAREFRLSDFSYLKGGEGGEREQERKDWKFNCRLTGNFFHHQNKVLKQET